MTINDGNNKALKRAHTPPSLQHYTGKHPSQNNKGEEKGALSNFKQELYITISINKYGENSIQDTTTIPCSPLLTNLYSKHGNEEILIHLITSFSRVHLYPSNLLYFFIYHHRPNHLHVFFHENRSNSFKKTNLFKRSRSTLITLDICSLK